MARRKKTKEKPEQNENTTKTIEKEIVPEDSESKDELKEAPVKKTAELYSLYQAIESLLYDPREHWTIGIKNRASLMGVNPHKCYPIETWREVFIAWGGHGVLK